MLHIKDPETGDMLLRFDHYEGQLNYPFNIWLSGGETGLTALEAKELYNYLGEFFGPQDLTNE